MPEHGLPTRLLERDKESGIGQLRSGIVAALSGSPIYATLSSTDPTPSSFSSRTIFKMMTDRPSNVCRFILGKSEFVEPMESVLS